MNTQQHIYEFDAIGSRFWLERLDDGVFIDTLKQAIDEYVARFDQQYSRFRDDSLVSELFRTGRIDHPPEELLYMLDLAKELYDATHGAFDIAVASTLSRLGYGPKEHSGTVPQNIWEMIAYTSEAVTLPGSVMLDFGGFGKGWLIDTLARLLDEHGVKRYIVNGGGDLIVNNDTPVEFALEDPHDPTKIYRTISLQHGALAGSNTIKRSWETTHGRKHHIIDPQTADSVHADYIASYVLAPTATIADALATIVLICPRQRTAIQKQYASDILLIRADQ